MDQKLDRERGRAEQHIADVRKLHSLEQEAVHSSRKLGLRDRLKAAFHLTRAWRRANQEGLRKEDFQNEVFARLRKPHSNRKDFRLNNWTLRRGEDPLTQDLTKAYRDSSTPQKALEPYFVGIAVAAEHCEADPNDWKLKMVRDLSIWSLTTTEHSIAPADDHPAETLAVLINAMCSTLAQRNRLADTFHAIRQMSCRWEMFGERLVATDQSWMETGESPISPVFDDCVEFESMFPYPSISLLLVPYAVGKPEVFHLVPEALLRPLDEKYLASEKYLGVGFGGSGEHAGRRQYNIPDDAPGLQAVPGEISWIRDVRLCIVPDGHGGFTGALESRPRVEVRFEDSYEFGGLHHVVGGYDIRLERALSEGIAEDGGPVFPHIRLKNGEAWRVTIPYLADGSFRVTEWDERNPDSTGYVFDPDPLGKPGMQLDDPFMLSYTSATPPYLRYWLTQEWSVSNVSRRMGKFGANCPWAPTYDSDSSKIDQRWSRDVPPLNEVNFPDRSSATWVECCLHNGLLKDALQAKIDLLQKQTSLLQAEWHAARERHSNALLRRWKDEDSRKGN